MSSITLVSVPRTSISVPSPAIASLKSIIEKKDHSAYCIDLNIEIFHSLDYSSYVKLDNYFQLDLRYFLNKSIFEVFKEHKTRLDKKDLQCYEHFLDVWADKILDRGTDWIGISLLSINSIICCFDLCTYLKLKNPSCKVVLGGPGVSTSGIMGKANFGDLLIENNLINDYIQGEGEEKIIDLLEDRKKDYYNQIDDLDNLPIPNYNDFDLTKYNNNDNLLSVTGSRGCVRNCSFCDIKSAWKKYRYRSGKSIAEEIIHYYNEYKVTDIQFTDSLINGSLKSFGDFLNTMIQAKEKNIISNSVKWSGQFICRPENQFREEWYQKMARAGVGQLYIGIESASESVLADMAKKLKYSDIKFMMEMLLKYEIQCDLLLIVGYPTETDEDFQKTIAMIKDFSIYNESGIISGVNLGKTMVVLPGSPIGKNLEHWQISYDNNSNWISKQNPTLTFEKRVERRIQIQKVCEDYGYIVRWPITTLKTIKEGIKNKSETI